MRSGDVIRQLARDIAKAPARAEEALQAQIQSQAQVIEGAAQSDTTAVMTSFGDGASVTGDLSDVDPDAVADELAGAAANIGARNILGL